MNTAFADDGPGAPNPPPICPKCGKAPCKCPIKDTEPDA